MKRKTIDLYSPTDVKVVRYKLLQEQDNICALTGMSLDKATPALDHNHKTQKVRAVLSRQGNAALGKIENLWGRYLSYWYNGTLSDFLRQCADYIEREDDLRWNHPDWLKRMQTDFNKLKPSEQRIFLQEMALQAKVPLPDISNKTKRDDAFRKLLLTRSFQFDILHPVLLEKINKESA